MRARWLLLLMAWLLAGCATLNREECLTRPPAALGLADGRAGYGLWRLDRHVASCARFGIAFDRDAYLQARAQGLTAYCTPDNGERAGLSGESYENVCPPDLEPAFLQRYLPAHRQYLIDRRPRRFWLPWPHRP